MWPACNHSPCNEPKSMYSAAPLTRVVPWQERLNIPPTRNSFRGLLSSMNCYSCLIKTATRNQEDDLVFAVCSNDVTLTPKYASWIYQVYPSISGKGSQHRSLGARTMATDGSASASAPSSLPSPNFAIVLGFDSVLRLTIPCCLRPALASHNIELCARPQPPPPPGA